MGAQRDGRTTLLRGGWAAEGAKGGVGVELQRPQVGCGYHPPCRGRNWAGGFGS